ncbi:MAG: retron St85 family RNA-directed DNA polymerase, partial [bacterium]
AYQPSTSILKNAQSHVQQRYLLKLDVKDFFPSIKPDDLLKHYERFIGPLDHFDRRVLSQVLFRRNKEKKQLELSIGAPSSPLISNTVFFSIDEEIQKHCATIGVTYTRYADDLAFSTNHPHRLTKLPEMVASILRSAEYPRLKLNDEKTVHTSKKHRRTVTGLTLTPEKVISVGRDKKRLIKALVHRYLLKQLSAEQIANLQGQLAFIHSVEPEFLDRLNSKYGANNMMRLFDHARKPPATEEQSK